MHTIDINETDQRTLFNIVFQQTEWNENFIFYYFNNIIRKEKINCLLIVSNSVLNKSKVQIMYLCLHDEFSSHLHDIKSNLNEM